MDNPYAPPTNNGPSFEFGSDSTGGKLTLPQILFSFEGRIPRFVYWMGTIGTVIAFYAAVFLLEMVFGGPRTGRVATSLLTLVLALVFSWSSVALQVKRWHDLNKSGWWMFIALIPCIGGIWQFIECGCTRGTPGANMYGPDPTDVY